MSVVRRVECIEARKHAHTRKHGVKRIDAESNGAE